MSLRRPSLLCMLLAVLVSALPTFAQTTTITFDPAVNPSGIGGGLEWIESGYIVAGNPAITIVGGDSPAANGPGFPDNGTSYAQLNPNGAGATLSRFDGSAFDFFSMDLAEWILAAIAQQEQPEDIMFRGVLEGGGEVFHTFTLDLVLSQGNIPDFETAVFPSTFRNLVEVEFLTDTVSFDNIVVSVPPAGTASAALVGMCLVQRRRRWG